MIIPRAAGHALAVALLSLFVCTLSATAQTLPALSPAEELAIARGFAPTLVFHPDELYFPTSSIGGTTIAPWPARVDQYRELTKPDKLNRAALAYRVFVRLQDEQLEVVVEYWCYYVYNAYAIRGAWLPYRVSGNHPHDLERLFLVLKPNDHAWDDDDRSPDDAWARSAFQISRIVANAHDGSIPPNQYNVREGESMALPITILVERGSHAMAPDINRDGRFTPGVDNTTVSKVRWGIRDRGSTWRWYRSSFMDARDASAVRIHGPVDVPGADAPTGPRYTLYPADDLQRWFQNLGLSEENRDDVLGRTPWLVRTFGDARVESLMAPLDPADGRELDKALRRRATTEAGFGAGFTTVDHSPTLVLSRRYFWEVPSPRYPDILAEAAVLFPASRRTLFEATLWGSYNLDAITNVIIGVGWFSETSAFSPAVGVEVRLGRFRIRPTWRLRDGGFDGRFTATF